MRWLSGWWLSATKHCYNNNQYIVTPTPGHLPPPLSPPPLTGSGFWFMPSLGKTVPCASKRPPRFWGSWSRKQPLKNGIGIRRSLVIVAGGVRTERMLQWFWNDRSLKKRTQSVSMTQSAENIHLRTLFFRKEYWDLGATIYFRSISRHQISRGFHIEDWGAPSEWQATISWHSAAGIVGPFVGYGCMFLSVLIYNYLMYWPMAMAFLYILTWTERAVNILNIFSLVQ